MFLTQTVPRQREIIEVVLRNGWDYMRRLLTGGKADEPQLPILGESPVRSLLRTALDLKSLSLQSPRQIELLLDRVTSETLQWNLSLQGLDGLRRTMDDAANRLSFSILVGYLIMGAAMISSRPTTSQLSYVSSILFAAASLLGLWLIISILRSGRLR
jgi:ubiquinone biosynthesis protein